MAIGNVLPLVVELIDVGERVRKIGDSLWTRSWVWKDRSRAVGAVPTVYQPTRCHMVSTDPANGQHAHETRRSGRPV